jgi:hypothetical protein
MRYFVAMILLAATALSASAQGFGPAATLGQPMGTSPFGGQPGGFSGSTGGFGLGGTGGFGQSNSNVSPYLNLLRGGASGSAAVNYYGIVRQQQSLQSSIQNLQQQQFAASQSDPNGPGDGLPTGITVGTRVRFLNTQPYFLNLNPSQGSSGTPSYSLSGNGQGRSTSNVLGGNNARSGGSRTPQPQGGKSSNQSNPLGPMGPSGPGGPNQ